ncbi:MAG: nicotinate phosphoribosyltransferase [Chloroflexi bacterium]|nr:nicotinate phosphoribosyltransferase [Chloroflexota bacterium]
MISDNIILATDSYKQSHHAMYQPGTEVVSSYFESRAGGEYPYCVFFGLQYLMDEHLSGAHRVTPAMIDEAEDLCRWHFGQELFNRRGWEHVVSAHDGRLPVSIRAAPEGSVIPESNVLFTIENTDPDCAWLTNHLETLLVQLWYPCTVATISREQKRTLKSALEKSGNPDNLAFMLHDFGYRGSSSSESAALGGAAHLVNFKGTDTIAGLRLLMAHYAAEEPGYSVPAAEHSTITAWGEDGELDAYRHILDRFHSGTVAVVSDSWNIFEACRQLWGRELRDEVADNRERTLVVRPDSGEPERVVVECLSILGEQFGHSVNGKGYKVLPDHVRLIQGDGITRHSLPGLCDAITGAGWSMDNMVFGSGGGLLQDCDRDTLRFALKCNWVQVAGVQRDVFKRPASDPAKNSKSGALKLVRTGKGFRTVGICENSEPDVLREVFRDGEVLVRDSLDAIRNRADL